MEQQISLFNKIAKEKKLQEMRNVLEATTDGVGKGLDKGMVETCALLNVMGYHTHQSCDGHGDHCAWISFKSPTEQAQDELTHSAYTQVLADARNTATKKVLEKFGEVYIKSLEVWTPEISDYWDEAYIEARDTHPSHTEFEVILNKIKAEQSEIIKQSEDLKNEFLDSINEPRESIFNDRGRLEFLTEDNFNNEIMTQEMIERSNELLQKFELFLKKKYLQS